MPVASKVAAKKVTAPAKKAGTRRSTKTESPVSTNNVAGGSVGAVDPVFVRDRAFQLALQVGIDNPTASKLITQAKRIEKFLLGNDTSDDEG